VRKYYASNKNATDEECWNLILENCEYDGNGEEVSGFIELLNPDGQWDFWQFEEDLDYLSLREGDKRVNSAPIRNIDFSMDMQAYANAIDEWDVIVDGKPKKSGKDYDSVGTRDDCLEQYGDRETYAKCQSIFHTFAVVTPDGKWHGEAEMVSIFSPQITPKQELEWVENYKRRFIDTSDPDWIITLVDCHI